MQLLTSRSGRRQNAVSVGPGGSGMPLQLGAVGQKRVLCADQQSILLPMCNL